MLDPFHADLICQLHRRAQAPQGRHVGAANPLKPFRAQGSAHPNGGDDGVPQPVDDLVSHIKKTGAFRRLQPFVRARGVHVATQFV